MATARKQPDQVTDWDDDDDYLEDATDDGSPFVGSFAAFVFALGFLALTLLGLFVDTLLTGDATRGTAHNVIHWLLICGAIASLICIVWTVLGLIVGIGRSRPSRSA